MVRFFHEDHGKRETKRNSLVTENECRGGETRTLDLTLPKRAL